MKIKKITCIPLIAFLITSIFLTQTVFAYSVDQLITSPTTNITNVGSNYSWSNNQDYSYILSNKPETFSEAGILYKDSGIGSNSATVKGKFRVFWSHHVASTCSSAFYVGMAIFNNTSKSIKINLGKYSHAEGAAGIPGLKAGQSVLANWLSHTSTEATYATIASGKYAYISFKVDVNGWGMGMYDVILRDAVTNALWTSGGVQVETYATNNSAGDPTSVLSGQKIIPTDSTINRGSSKYASKSLTWNAGVNQEIAFTSTTNNPWNPPINDTDNAYDMYYSRPTVIQGSYGIDLNITVHLNAKSAIAISPSRASDGNYTDWIQRPHYLAVKVNGTVKTFTKDTLTQGMSWIIATGNAGDTITIQTSLPANDLSPLRLTVLPN